MMSVNILCAVTLTVTGSIIGGLSIYFWNKERKAWNKGICPECNKPWEFVGFDKEGNRVYTCGKHICVISYEYNIDK